MGIARGPNVINDGLVFGYDTGYGIADNNTTTRFYQGEPVTNLWDSMLNTQSLRTHTKHYWNGIKWTEDSTYTHPGVNGPKDTYLGLVFKHTSGALNSSWSGNSYGYMLRDIACTSGATMAMSSWVYASIDCDVTAIPASIEGESGGETSTSSTSPTSYDLNNKGTWQVLAKKANSDGNVRFIPLYPRKDGVTNGSFAGFFMWALPQVAYGDHVVPPIQPGATRSDTASLIDLKRTASIDVGDVSFDSNAQPEFDGTDDIISQSRIIDTADYSAEFVFKADVNTSGTEHWLGSQYPGTGRIIFDLWTNNKLRNFINGTSITGATTIATGNWYHAIFTRNSSGVAHIYLNGVQDATGSISTSTPVNDPFDIGGSTTLTRWFNGSIAVVRIYNTVITATQAAQNYKAYKNRFNI